MTRKSFVTTYTSCASDTAARRRRQLSVSSCAAECSWIPGIPCPRSAEKHRTVPSRYRWRSWRKLLRVSVALGKASSSQAGATWRKPPGPQRKEQRRENTAFSQRPGFFGSPQYSLAGSCRCKNNLLFRPSFVSFKKFNLYPTDSVHSLYARRLTWNRNSLWSQRLVFGSARDSLAGRGTLFFLFFLPSFFLSFDPKIHCAARLFAAMLRYFSFQKIKLGYFFPT